MINPIGKKAKEWAVEKAKRIKELVTTGNYQVIKGKVFGLCKDCNQYRELDPDHKVKRSQGGKHGKDNLDWVCRKCHNERDNMGDPKHKKPKKLKADWQRSHKCVKCGVIVSSLLCSNCGELSIAS